MSSTLVVRPYSLTLYRLTLIVFYVAAAAAQLSATSSSANTTSTTSTSDTTTTTSTSNTTAASASASSSAAWISTETGPPSFYQAPLDPQPTPLPGLLDWCPRYHGASWTPIAPGRLGDIESFRVDGSVLSFTIFCGVNIPEDPVLNPYVLDVATNKATSFDDCLQSCAQYSTRHNPSFGNMCSGVTWDKQGICWLKTGVGAIVLPMQGPNGAISAILQWPPKRVGGLTFDTNINFFSKPALSAVSENGWYNSTCGYTLCSTGFC